MKLRTLLIGILITIFFVPFSVFAERQDLDEALARKARYGENTPYNGSVSPNYWWQPETLSHIDTNYSTEVWRLTFQRTNMDIISYDHANNGWSADGKRLGFAVKPLGAYPYISRQAPELSDPSAVAWVMFTDGTGLRGTDIPCRRGATGGISDFGWSHTEPNKMYKFSDSQGYTRGDILKSGTFDSNNLVSNSTILDLGTGRPLIAIKEFISSDDQWIVAISTSEYTCTECPNAISTQYLYLIHNTETPHLEESWGIARACGPTGGDPYGDHVASYENQIHDAYLLPSGQSILLQYGDGGVWWEFVKVGHYADGGPAWENWDGDSFGTNEDIKCVADGANSPENPYGNAYWGHPTFDRWGRYVLEGTYTDAPLYPGTRVGDRNSNWNLESNYVMNYNKYDGQHHSWNGWTDYVVATDTAGSNKIPVYIQTNKYTASYGDASTIASLEYGYGYKDNYMAYPRPSQSPDGTKVLFHTILFHSAYADATSDDDYVSMSYAVAYNPYPPEIYSISATEGTVTVRGDWGTNSGTWRGYTQRKWVDETTGTYLPPREINQWRLWRSADKITWIPLTPSTANAWDRYNFKTGTWTGNTYWELTDTPGNGAWYYALTSIETSGLESHKLSNIFSITVAGGNGTGAQDTAYPTDPGGMLNNPKYKGDFGITNPSPPQTFTVTHQKSPATAVGQYTLEWTEPADTTLIRHYNIYASDSSLPTAVQNRRIASISRNVCIAGSGSWVDWLGDTGGVTMYGITSVDTQGNESSILTSNSTIFLGVGGDSFISIGTGGSVSSS